MIRSGMRSDGLRAGMWGADFSACETYRYSLWREFNLIGGSVMRRVNFIMLNPSTADETKNDPTVERCMRRAITWGFDALDVTNLFALRSTDPIALRSHASPVGPGNDESILRVAKIAELVIVAWGQYGPLQHRAAVVLAMLREAGIALHALKVSKDGSPAHPLYLPYTLQPQPYDVEVTNA